MSASMILCNDIISHSDGMSMCMSAAQLPSLPRRPSSENRYFQGDCSGIEKSRRIRLAHQSGRTVHHQRREDKMLADWEQIHSGFAVELENCFDSCPTSPDTCHPVRALSQVCYRFSSVA